MAAKALLTGAGLLNTSTATKHATSSSQPDSAARSVEDDFIPVKNIPCLGFDDLDKIVALLRWMAQDFQSKIHIDDIHIEAIEAVIRNTDVSTKAALGSLHTASASKLSDLIDIMMLQTDGSPKDANVTLQFMRRVARIREEVRATTGDNATERVELDEDAVSLCYQKFGRMLITHDLRPQQKRDKGHHFAAAQNASGFDSRVNWDTTCSSILKLKKRDSHQELWAANARSSSLLASSTSQNSW